MYSYFWNFINTQKPETRRSLAYVFLVLVSVLFSVPRYREAWFYYTTLAYPLLVAGILELTKRLLPLAGRIQEISLALVEQKSGREQLAAWWAGFGHKGHLLLCMVVALLLASLSLVFNINPNWSRYTDALGIFYIGFMVGDLLHLLLGIEAGIQQLRDLPLKLNPLDPANTVDLRKLAEMSFTIAISAGFSLLALNLVVAFASYLFRHLIGGVILLSILAWSAILILSIYPHLVFWQIVHAKKQETMRMLEARLFTLYQDVKKKGVVPPAIEEISKLQTQIMKNKSSPASGSDLFSIFWTLALNIVPLLLKYFKIDLP